MKTAAVGAATATYAATAGEKDARRVAGKYLVNCNVAGASRGAAVAAVARARAGRGRIERVDVLYDDSDIASTVVHPRRGEKA